MTEITKLLDKLSELYAQRDLLAMQKQEMINAVLTPEIRAKLAEIDAETAPMFEAVNANAAELEATVKATVLEHGATVKGAHLQAVYVKGRVSWDTDKLDGMAALIPQLNEARKVGQPSVAIRK